MRKSSWQGHLLTSDAEPDVVRTDDGGSGLFEACKARFAPPEYEVKCDPIHTVWVKRADGGRSVGLPPWLLRQHSLDEVLERVETRIGVPVVGR